VVLGPQIEFIALVGQPAACCSHAAYAQYLLAVQHFFGTWLAKTQSAEL